MSAFKIVFLIGWIIYEVFAGTRGKRVRRENRITDDRKAGWETVFSFVAFAGMQVLPIVYILWPWFNFADYQLPDVAGWLGAALFALVLWIIWRAHVDLGCNWSPTLQIREGHSLVTDGIYRSIRHPIYLAMWLWGIAEILLLQNWLVALVGLLSFAPVYLHRVPHEEQMMLDNFGDDYRAYMERTGRIIPRFRRSSRRSENLA